MPEYTVWDMPNDVDPMVRGYLECAEWAGLSEQDSEALELAVRPMWSTKALEGAKGICSDYMNYVLQISRPAFQELERRPELAGHDLFLTQNRHGAGFWDGGWKHGGVLTSAAHTMGSQDVWYDADNESMELG